ncbi:MAG TPA: DUF1249 domain-containing protein [Xanthomonadales bacterium]|nr:DUF1249 domain-containing protein [Xanthomonadales bacterium]
MVDFSQPNGLYSRPKLKRLQAVQAEIFRQLQLLLPDQIAFHDHLVSNVAGSPPLLLEVIERHKYTTFFRLTYRFNEKSKARFSPNAHIRHYHDARLAEATSFNPEQGCGRMAEPGIPTRPMMQIAWRRNRALDRWLDYLITQGHSLATMVPIEENEIQSFVAKPALTG